MGHRRLTAGLVAAAIAFTTSAVVEAGPSGGALPPELIKVVDVAGNYGIPDDADMVAFNLTAVNAAATGRLTAFPCDADEIPRVSNLNYLQGDIVPNFSLTRIADDGTICIYTKAITDVLVDIVGYVPNGSAITPLPEPHRIHNTRDTGQPAQAGTTINIDITAHPDIPDTADVVMFNLTAANAHGPGHARVHACDTDKPATSALNYTPERATANFVTSRIAPDGTICIWTRTTTHLMVDVVAYSTNGITPLPEPIRIRNTRNEPTPPQAGDTLTINLADHLPDTANAALYNLTAADPQQRGYATSHPCNQPRPKASNLNYTPHRNAAAGTITKLAPNGTICIYTKSTTNYIIDLTAYTTDVEHYTPLPNPIRAINTRDGWQATCDWVMRHNLGGAHLVDIRSGTKRNLAPPTDDHRVGGPGPALRPTCDGIWWLIIDPDDVTDDRPLGLYGQRLDGSLESYSPLAPSMSDLPLTSGHLEVAADGTAVYVDAWGRHWNAHTGEMLWVGPFGGHVEDDSPIRSVALGGSTGVYVRQAGPYRADGTIDVWDWRAGEPISSGTLDVYPWHIDVTRDGAYIAYVSLTELQGDTLFGQVRTTDGALIDFAWAEVGTGYDVHFMGTGELAICVPKVGWFRWSLFGAIVYQDHIVPDDFCGRGVGF